MLVFNQNYDDKGAGVGGHRVGGSGRGGGVGGCGTTYAMGTSLPNNTDPLINDSQDHRSMLVIRRK